MGPVELAVEMAAFVDDIDRFTNKDPAIIDGTSTNKFFTLCRRSIARRSK